MKKHVTLVSVFLLLLNACKEEPKCCCTNFSILYNVLLKDTSTINGIDTNYIKANNQLYSFLYTDSIIYLQLQANIDSAQDDKKVNTVNLFNISSTDIDTITTEINGTCGRSITKIWYNGVLKYPNSAYDSKILVVK